LAIPKLPKDVARGTERTRSAKKAINFAILLLNAIFLVITFYDEIRIDIFTPISILKLYLISKTGIREIHRAIFANLLIDIT
jgi:hypothetical protein